jgi:hypothetical protein
MIADQLERLKADSDNLRQHERFLREEGEVDLVKKIMAKRSYLDNFINELSNKTA